MTERAATELLTSPSVASRDSKEIELSVSTGLDVPTFPRVRRRNRNLKHIVLLWLFVNLLPFSLLTLIFSTKIRCFVGKLLPGVEFFADYKLGQIYRKSYLFQPVFIGFISVLQTLAIANVVLGTFSENSALTSAEIWGSLSNIVVVCALYAFRFEVASFCQFPPLQIFSSRNCIGVE